MFKKDLADDICFFIRTIITSAIDTVVLENF